MGFTLWGNDEACQILDSGYNQRQTFDKNHEIFTGVLHIYEGETIARPKCDILPKGVKTIARSSSDKPCIMCYDDLRNGRIVVDTGFTKLYEECYRKTAGTSRYFVNALCWLGKTY